MRVPCPQCGKFPPPECDCPPLPPGPPDPVEEEEPPPQGGTIGLRRERRRGRDVIVLHDVPEHVEVRDLAKALKDRCATGGTVKAREIELQGDHRDAVEEFLREQGFRTKRTGG